METFSGMLHNNQMNLDQLVSKCDENELAISTRIQTDFISTGIRIQQYIICFECIMLKAVIFLIHKYTFYSMHGIFFTVSSILYTIK